MRKHKLRILVAYLGFHGTFREVLSPIQNISKSVPFVFENHSSGTAVQWLSRRFQVWSWKLHYSWLSIDFFYCPLEESATQMISPSEKRLKHKTSGFIEWLFTFRQYLKSIWNTDFLFELAETLSSECRSQFVITSVNKWACCFPVGYESSYWVGSAWIET